MIYLQIWIAASFIMMLYFSIIKNWNIYYPKWAVYRQVDEETGLVYINEDKTVLYRLIICFTFPLSCLYLIAKYAKNKSNT